MVSQFGGRIRVRIDRDVMASGVAVSSLLIACTQQTLLRYIERDALGIAIKFLSILPCKPFVVSTRDIILSLSVGQLDLH